MMYRVRSIYKAGRVDSLSIILYTPWVKQVQVCEYVRPLLYKFKSQVFGRNWVKWKYNGRRLYQYNEDDFFIWVLIVEKIFELQVYKQPKRSLFYLTASLDF